ncbi:MAG: preprotein translocase subunit YajC [Muribaculaceae bacterium]|nr:preprotein translocase subunit YajC [Muribaculaceae bacterium]
MNLIILQAAQQGGGGYTGIIMIVAMVAIFYFFMIRPQNKKQKEIKKAREALGNGDRVVTAGGIYGKIKETGDTTFIIEIASGVNIKIEKTSVYPAPETVQKDAKK